MIALQSTQIETPLGEMISISDAQYLYLLAFNDHRGLAKHLQRLKSGLQAEIAAGENAISKQIQKELSAYFAGRRSSFQTPCYFCGTNFQQSVWHALQTIPFGETRAYADIAQQLQHETAYRAVANANGANPLTLIVPCHRVINKNGGLGGYAGTIERKAWLLAHEKKCLEKATPDPMTHAKPTTHHKGQSVRPIINLG